MGHAAVGTTRQNVVNDISSERALDEQRGPLRACAPHLDLSALKLFVAAVSAWSWAPFSGVRQPCLPLAHTRRHCLEETSKRKLGFIVRLHKCKNISVHTKATYAAAWTFCHSPKGVSCNLKQITVRYSLWWRQQSGECGVPTAQCVRTHRKISEHCEMVIFI